MHVQIRQNQPGNSPSIETEENPELKEFRQRFFWTLPLKVPLAALAMLGDRVSLLNAAVGLKIGHARGERLQYCFVCYVQNIA